jgi:hypothetical protein
VKPWKKFSYDLGHWPFPELVALAIGEVDLTLLTLDGPRWTDRDDQKSPWHRVFYDAFPEWRWTYVRFVHEVVAPHVGEPFFYQAVPTFRVHLPGNVAVGTFHTDATYHHPLGEETFWLPLTDAHDSSSVWIADDADALHAVDARPGDVVRFSAVTRRHGNVVNRTGLSRVSFDFRCLPARLLPEVEGPPSEHAKLRFVPGGYYASELVTP